MPQHRWGPDAPPESQPVDLVVYRSRLLGAESDLVLWGGGNTSVKTTERDHVGREREVLRIKGSGTDLKSIDRSGFPGVFRDEILPLLQREDMSDEEMVAYLEHCMVEVAGRRPSIETLLHGFLPYRHIDHTHADAIVTLTNTEGGRDHVREALGEGIAYVPYRRPGFLLSKQVQAAAQGADAVVLANHGLITWGDTAEESYRKHIELVQRADEYLDAQKHPVGAGPSGGPSTPAPSGEPSSPPQPLDDLPSLLLKLRGRLGHVILRLDTSPDMRAIADRDDIHQIAAAGPATPDHVLRIRPWACVVDNGDPDSAVNAYEQRYRDWFDRYAGPDLELLSPLPKVFVVPGLGMVTAARDAKDAEVTAEVATHTLSIAARGRDAYGNYQPVGDQDLFDVEYWPLELYKLTLAPPPKELAGRVIVVTGAARGIGRAIARRLAGLGGQLAILDINGDGLEQTGQMIVESGAPKPLCITIDLTHEDAVKDAIKQIITAFGGIDALVSNAGIAPGGHLTDLDPAIWRQAMEVNATSHFVMTADVMTAMRTQGMGGSLVYTTSKNAFSPGAGFGAYSASKAAQLQLMRIAALEGGADRIRSNAVNPDAIFEDSSLWSDDLRRDRASAHGIEVHELEDFYAKRNLLKTRITGDDVAEAVAFLISDRSNTITGAVIPVDGGVPAAFPR